GVGYVASIDRRTVGDGAMGPVTRRLRDYYERVVTGREPRYAQWLTPTYARTKLAV
ncbi:MAG: hypothetical protein JOY98_05105, partial [Candidatus Eremiobacteraeota bacterium]|nr:hypothetical protein [Candidatus Eremiobacteraeota bacterium]